MEDVFKKPVHLSKGLNLKDLMSHQGEFHLDMDFTPKKDGIDLTEYGELMPEAEDDDDSDDEDVFENVEKRLEQTMLATPEYLSFEDLASRMVEVPCQHTGAVKISILEQGDGPLVPADAEVTIHYAAYWENNKLPFDSSLTIKDGNRMRIRMNTGSCLPGIELALMNVRGPKARLIALLNPEVTWGKGGAWPRIPPKQSLFVIALYSVNEAIKCPAFNSLTIEEQTKYATTLQTVESLRNQAKEQFQRKKYDKAISTYQQATYVLSLSRPETEQEEKHIKNLKIAIYVNLCVCYSKINKPNKIITMCKYINTFINIETHCKAMFYKGRAYEMQGLLEKAIECYKTALKNEPNNKEVGLVLAELDEKIRRGKEDELVMWKKVFKSTDKKEVVYIVDNEFESGVKELCDDLAAREEFTKVELPTGLSEDEVACVRHEAEQLNLRVEEEGKGKRRRVAIMKVVL